MLKLVVTTIIPSTNGPQHVWFVFETAHKSMNEFFEDLADDYCVLGKRVTTQNVDGKRVVTKREDHIVGVNGVVTIAPCHVEYVEAEAA